MSDVDNSYRGLAHVKLTDLVGSPSKIDQEVKKAGHTDSLENPVLPQPDTKVIEPLPVQKKESPPLPPMKGVKGRAFTFKGTGERVTVVRERVGNTYEGNWIHEVISRDGKKFLASMRQLVDIV